MLRARLLSQPGFRAGPVSDWDELAEINHIFYTSKVSIGELDIHVELPPNDRYLWDFATLPGRQGRGIYPRLLQSILEQEIQNAKRF